MRQKDNLYGRADEQTTISDTLADAARGEGRALVVRGEAGIGKSALLERAASAAKPMRVLRATGTESESGLAFAALHQLLWPVTGRLDAPAGRPRRCRAPSRWSGRGRSRRGTGRRFW
ncbi:ATP-binding protein [Nonomuraea dietziae]|uniref:ATP-binding protein n=1 Tax=Nonomuraea dietziae TaxID=65515 RepID=UPI003423D820